MYTLFHPQAQLAGLFRCQTKDGDGRLHSVGWQTADKRWCWQTAVIEANFLSLSVSSLDNIRILYYKPYLHSMRHVH